MEIPGLSDLLFTGTTTALLLVLYYKFGYYIISSKFENPCPQNEKRKIPMASGRLPIIGHILFIWFNTKGFMDSCFRKYGEVFCIQIFRRKLVIVGNHEMVSKYFKKPENEFSLGQILEGFNFGWTFYASPDGLEVAMDFLKKLVSGTDFHRLVQKMDVQCKLMKSRMKKSCDDGHGHYISTMDNEISQFIAQTTYASFIDASVQLPDDLLSQIKKFNGLVNNCILLSYILPQWFIKLLYIQRIRNSTKYLMPFFQDLVKSYRMEDKAGDEDGASALIKSGMAHVQKNGSSLTDGQIAELILALMYVSTENTAIGVMNTLTYLSLPENSKYVERLRKELSSCENLDQILSAEYLNACVHEGARISTHVFALHRKPMVKDVVTIGDYYCHAKDVDSIALSGSLLMVDGNAGLRQSDVDPTKFNPERFLGKPQSSFRSPNLVTWGGGLHACPGRVFATYELKIAIAYLIQHFNFDVVEISDWNFFTPIAFGKRNIVFDISPLKTT